jgi:hypothetical protein
VGAATELGVERRTDRPRTKAGFVGAALNRLTVGQLWRNLASGRLG